MFGVLFKNILFRAYNFIKRVSLKPNHFLETEKDDKRFLNMHYIQTRVPVDIIRTFLISDFLAESLKANENQRKISIHFCSKASLILRFSTHSTLKKFTPATQRKTFLTLQIFQQTSGWCQKKHLHCLFLDTQELHSRSTLKTICIFMYISVRKYLLQRRSKLLSGGVSGVVDGGRGREMLNNSLRQLAVWVS